MKLRIFHCSVCVMESNEWITLKWTFPGEKEGRRLTLPNNKFLGEMNSIELLGTNSSSIPQTLVFARWGLSFPLRGTHRYDMYTGNNMWEFMLLVRHRHFCISNAWWTNRTGFRCPAPDIELQVWCKRSYTHDNSYRKKGKMRQTMELYYIILVP